MRNATFKMKVALRGIRAFVIASLIACTIAILLLWVVACIGRGRVGYSTFNSDTQVRFVAHISPGTASISYIKLRYYGSAPPALFVRITGFYLNLQFGSNSRRVGCLRLSISVWVLLTLLGGYPLLVLIRGPVRRRIRIARGLCANCGYNLTGNMSGVCPECGKQI
jgi:hypothetical protein